jgi:hypothetical protein
VVKQPHRIRRALAESLRTIITTCQPIVASPTLHPSLLTSAQMSLWPTPHSKIFDFAATSRGAVWIDEIADDSRLQGALR